MRNSVFIIGIPVIFIMSGCTLYRKPVVPTVAIPAHFKYATVYKNKNLSGNWWENFKDPKLNRLVHLALCNNYNYLATLKNINIARTFVTQNKSQLYPQISANFNVSRNQLSQNSVFNTPNNLVIAQTAAAGTGVPNPIGNRLFNSYQLFGTVSYEIDVWNQIRNSVHQAQADLCTEIAQTNVVKLTLISDVVDTYLQITATAANLNNLTQQLHFSDEKLYLNLKQYKSGLLDVAPIVDLKNQIETIKANIANLKKQRQTLQATLAYLVGAYPETFNISINNTLRDAGFSKMIPAALPSTMLANRPDVQAAYFQILSYGYLVKQNIANFLPSFNLTGNYGFASTMLSNLFSAGSVFWNYGISIMQQVFTGGLLKSQYQRSKYQYQQAILTYKDTVVKSFKEVDSALIAYQNDFLTLKTNQNQVNNLKEKLDLATAQYKGGLTDYSTYLTDELSYYQADFNLTNQRLLVAQDIIQVYKTLALGL